MSAVRKPPEARPSKLRSKVTNGQSLLPGIDGRSPTARRYRDVMMALVMDAGGLDHVSEAKLGLIRRFSATVVLSEQMEARLAQGEEINVSEFCTLSSTLVRLAGRIGIGRHAKNVTPNLEEYIATSFKLDPVTGEEAA